MIIIDYAAIASYFYPPRVPHELSDNYIQDETVWISLDISTCIKIGAI